MLDTYKNQIYRVCWGFTRNASSRKGFALMRMILRASGSCILKQYIHEPEALKNTRIEAEPTREPILYQWQWLFCWLNKSLFLANLYLLWIEIKQIM